MRCVMDGSNFTVLGETPYADPMCQHAPGYRVLWGLGLDTLGYPITWHILAYRKIQSPNKSLIHCFNF